MKHKKYLDNHLFPFQKTYEAYQAFSFATLSDNELTARSTSLKERRQSGEGRDSLIAEAFALCGEAVKRTLGLTPFRVQILAAAAMSEGRIIEFSTGEGKTLAAVFTAYLWALDGKGVHILTFNDYLAKRDANWMKPVYDMLSVDIAYIQEGMDAKKRKAAYEADVTYLTAKEAGFDYLKRFLAYHPDEIAGRDFYFAIVDEADSILIDEARIPLVVASDDSAAIDMGRAVLEAVRSLTEETHYIVESRSNSIFLTEDGILKMEDALNIRDIYESEHSHLLTKINLILQAVYLFKKDIDYIVREGEILLVDEFTGRVRQNCRFPDGLHAAMELKEGLTTREYGTVLGNITVQNFLRLYPNLSGMTGTAVAAAPEFYEFYDKIITVIPNNRPCIRKDRPDLIFATKQEKRQAVIAEIMAAHAVGRPVLVGTANIEESESLAVELREAGLSQFSVLNAKNDETEGEVIAGAGKRGAVTVSTNMAGRGVDIRLGGKEGEGYDEIAALGGLYVIGTNRHESVRIDHQLRGRAGRQGDPGESRYIISLEDDLLVKFGVKDYVLRKGRVPEEGPVTAKSVGKIVAHIQRVAEGYSTDIKINLAKYFMMLEKQRAAVTETREEILYERRGGALLESADAQLYMQMREQLSEEEWREKNRIVELYAINRCWAEYLAFADTVLDDVRVIGNLKNDTFFYINQKLDLAFTDFEKDIYGTVQGIYQNAVIENGTLLLDESGISQSTSTKTYMIEEFSAFSAVGSELAAGFINAPLYFLYMLGDLFKKRDREE